MYDYAATYSPKSLVKPSSVISVKRTTKLNWKKVEANGHKHEYVVNEKLDAKYH